MKILIITVLLGVVLLFACQGEKAANKEESPPTTVSFAANSEVEEAYLTEESTIHGWIKNNNDIAIATHGWEIWDYLTKETGETFMEIPVREFETWVTDHEVVDWLQSPNPLDSLNNRTRKLRGNADSHTQFDFHKTPTKLNTIEYVKYNFHAAEHVIENRLLDKSILEKMKAAASSKPASEKNVPDFPTNAVVIKPVIVHISKDDKDGLFAVPAWSGDEGDINRSFGQNDWRKYVFIDVTNSETSLGDGSLANNVTATDCVGCRYKINNFIHWRLTKEDAEHLNENEQVTNHLDGDGKAQEGDYFVVMAMHVTSREMKRWTWQTFYWTATPNAVHLPSNSTIAAARKGIVSGAPAHYAMSIGYDMVKSKEEANRPTPYASDVNIEGEPIYCYNPYLEAGFNDLGVTNKANKEKYVALTQSDKGAIMNQYGMQSNCMSCHGMANFNGSFDMVGDMYVSFGNNTFYGAPFFDIDDKKMRDIYPDSNYLRTEFLWSLERTNK